MTYVAPTEPMKRYARSLLSERQYPYFGDTGPERVAEFERRLATRELDKFELMGVIDYLKVAPMDTESGLPIGVYRRNGEIFVVKLTRKVAGREQRKYVSKLVELTGSAERLTEDDERVKIDFVYAPGMLAQLRPEDQMTLEEARPFIIRYGKCIYCRTPLKAADSVERGVGPVCIKRYRSDNGLTKTVPEVSEETQAELTDLLAQLTGGAS